jgi:uncharacterized RDD family membrane protein YckC
MPRVSGERVLTEVPPDARVWWFVRDGRKWGPVSWRELNEMLASDNLPPTLLIWREGMSDWMSMDAVAQLAPPVAQYGPTLAPDGTLSYFTPRLEFVYAGFWLRVGAFIIDMIIILGPMMALVILVEAYAPEVGNNPYVEPLGAVVGHCTAWLYFALQESSRRQATIGKRMFGLKVTDVNGEPIRFGRATGRHFAKYLSGLPLYVGYLMAGWTRQKQGLHDVISGCLVLRR